MLGDLVEEFDVCGRHCGRSVIYSEEIAGFEMTSFRAAERRRRFMGMGHTCSGLDGALNILTTIKGLLEALFIEF